jgi:hypothetical protein
MNIMKSQTYCTLLSRIVALLLSLALVPALTWAQPTPNPPGQISYQGFLTDANGVPLALSSPKNYDVNFRIYNVPSGGTAMWGEIQTVTVDRGYFSVLLGQGAALSSGEPWTNNLAGIFTASDASDRYLGMTVKGITTPDSEIQPRLRLLAGPYAFLAARANNAVALNGYDWSTIFTDTGNPATGTIPASKLRANSIGAGQIAAGAIGANQLAAGAVGSSQLANAAVGTAQLAAGSVTTADLANGAVTSAQIASGAVGSSALAPPINISVDSPNGSAYCCCPIHLCFYTGRALSAYNTDTGGGYGIISSGYWGLEALSDVSGNAAYLATTSYGGDFSGDLYVSGAIYAGTKDFKIDHPVDPANKYLQHSCIESSERKNLYDGMAVLDAQGEAVVQLPDWFEALNQDFRYQLTAVGGPGPGVYIAKEISHNSFKIAGGAAGLKVSWQVSGTRHDAFAAAHPLQVEEDKPTDLKGYYLHPEELGLSKDKNLDAVRRAHAHHQEVGVQQ